LEGLQEFKSGVAGVVLDGAMQVLDNVGVGAEDITKLFCQLLL
jgi:hypothetical protein